ncbi:MAG: prepilin-type N-terminal cleavage/methylation domain-containing protein [Candidatus Omnitrophica bacterium]|nr:prepilin-type N-terminal cleavage/methylation domain-containing protein [Candidatus Omnitrophota bacterium]MCM8793516.1 prepilin-type N-terminal cleavage/methylation domain-containing protein [Candidatus Omnitrophota bacterium]
MRKKKAFTVLELMLVIGIMAVLAILVLANFSGFIRGRKFEDCLNRVINFLRYGQEYALTRYDDIWMDVLPKENKFVLKLSEEKEKRFVIPPGYRMETKLRQVIFERMGGIGVFDRPVKKGEAVPTKIVEKIKVIDEKTKRIATIEIWGYGGLIFLKSIVPSQ